MITTIAFYSALIYVAAIIIQNIIEDGKGRYKRKNDKNYHNEQLMIGMAEDEERGERQYE